MLVLRRKVNEAIMVGDHIKIVVVDVRGDKVKLGIAAPSGVPVHRDTVYDAIQREGGIDLKRPPVVLYDPSVAASEFGRSLLSESIFGNDES